MGQIFYYFNLPFAWVMKFLDSFTGNYAITLLLFAIMIKVILLPIGIKQQKNQIKQASLRPKEMAIKKKYAGRTDKATQQKQQQEIMEMYQREKFNPMGGCLPLIIQMVIIISLYSIIRNPLSYICGINADSASLTEIFNSIINNAQSVAQTLSVDIGKLTLENLTKLFSSDQITVVSYINSIGADALGALKTAVPELSTMPNFMLFGMDLSMTPSLTNPSWLLSIPVVCTVLQFVTMKVQKRFMYQPDNAAANGASMKIMDWTMPLMSLWFCFILPGAIGIYWIYQNILSFGQQVLLSKVMPLPVFSEDDFKKAEKEFNAKAPKKSEMKRVRSLHHIDDDDYDSLPDISAKPKETKKAGAVESAPLKEDRQEQTLLNGEPVDKKKNKDN